MTKRTIWHEYFELTQLPVGEIPYSTIQRALKDEKYLRKFEPTFCRNDLLRGNLSALLYWYPNYVEQLYALSVEGHSYMSYFNGLPSVVVEAFNYLFPELIKKLDKAKELAVKLTVLDEIKIKRKKPNYAIV
jgi:hypothetical protein